MCLFLSLLACLSPLVFAASPDYCPLLGPIFPAPRALSTSSAFLAAKNNISSALEAAIAGTSPLNDVFDPNTTSFAIQVFSTDDAEPLFESYYTAPNVNTSVGVSVVNEDTVFRIGSGSKIWTILLMLIERGDMVFRDPVAKYVPEIRRMSTNPPGNEIDSVRWKEVTIGQLASHLAGISRDYGFVDLATLLPDPSAIGLPELSAAEIPQCGAPGSPCDRKRFFDGFLKRHPVVPTASAPVYSNAAFQILGYALEAMTGQSYQTLLSRDLIRPLNLTRSSYNKPADRLGVIPGDVETTWWTYSLGDETPTGGLYSSTKDVATLGRAILDSRLLSSSITRRWLKPASHTSSLGLAVGAPWETYSFPSSRVVDLHAKAGDLGSYSSMLALSPDHKVGFTILIAGTNTHWTAAYLSDLLANSLLPALDEAAKEEAILRFVGSYFARNSSSSLTITTDDGPGLKVETWLNEGNDMFNTLSLLVGASITDLSVRLYPTGLKAPGRVSFRAVFRNLSLGVDGIGPFSQVCATWFLGDAFVYGAVGLDEFVFDVDKQGKAVAVEARGVRMILKEAELAMTPHISLLYLEEEAASPRVCR
ncbi:serine hydrolase domain-containing protein [Aspergillus aculeatinus CBS 121060]|uniref:Beta-lactamase/transpeptidase-like protein n=1 Tax=Aspergillus aculeatinus CBS 121060 TaxID=1448322 RepID=A0ACD1HJL8_9EURO|nr:beta-lactamase/transpeptidase-like protein [Aspergillus aculeatinus CBS 121060]RAH73667.1 beta-lactamase/transpeptidase-like protein [Aspergillus aculeatinus CBS 121060]